MSRAEEGSSEEMHEAQPSPIVRRAPRLTRGDVFRAADELVLAGQRPTIDRVRTRLGRGSPNTINEHLDVWWRELGSRLRGPTEEFPGIPVPIGKILQELWTEALEAARGAMRVGLEERERAVRARELAAEDQGRLIGEREQILAGRAVALEEALALAREQLAAANRRAETIEQASQERTTELLGLRERLTAGERERQRMSERYDAAEARWLTEVDRARQNIRDQARERSRLRSELRVMRDERDRLRRERSAAEKSRTRAVKKAKKSPDPVRRERVGARKKTRRVASR